MPLWGSLLRLLWVVFFFFPASQDFADFYSSFEFLWLGGTAEPLGTARQALS